MTISKVSRKKARTDVRCQEKIKDKGKDKYGRKLVSWSVGKEKKEQHETGSEQEVQCVFGNLKVQ